MLGGRCSLQLHKQIGRLVPEHTILGGWCSPQLHKQTGRPVPERTMLGGRCSHRLSKRQTSRPVLEHLMLGGRYSPQVYHIHLTKDSTYFWKNPITTLMRNMTESPVILSVCCIKRGACELYIRSLRVSRKETNNY